MQGKTHGSLLGKGFWRYLDVVMKAGGGEEVGEEILGEGKGGWWNLFMIEFVM